MPTQPILVFSGRKLEPAYRADLAVLQAVAMKPAASGTVEYALGTVLGRVTATGLYTARSADADDGSEVAVGLLAYDVSVDATGMLALTTTPGASGEHGERTQNIGMYISGFFFGQDLVQSGAGSLDETAMADLNGRFVEGSLANGVFRF